MAFEAGPWGRKYPAIGQSWRRVWQEVIPFFSFPGEVRRIIYTTNAIEVLNFKLRRAIRARGHFPSDEAAAKFLYLILNRPEKGMGDATSRMGYGKGSVRRHLRRSLRKGPGGLMFNRPPKHGIPDNAATRRCEARWWRGLPPSSSSSEWAPAGPPHPDSSSFSSASRRNWPPWR